VTDIVDGIHWTYFYGIGLMGMKDRSLIDKINPTFILLTATTTNRCLLASKTSEFRVPPQFGPGGGAQCKRNTRNINHGVNNACRDVFRRRDEDFQSASPLVGAKMIDNIRSMIRRRIHSTGTDPAMAQHHNNQCSCDEDCIDYVPDELKEQPVSSLNCLCSFVAPTEAST